MTKMAAIWLKSIPNLWPKRLKNHTLWGRPYLYSPYKGVPPPGVDHRSYTHNLSSCEIKAWKIKTRKVSRFARKFLYFALNGSLCSAHFSCRLWGPVRTLLKYVKCMGKPWRIKDTKMIVSWGYTCPKGKEESENIEVLNVSFTTSGVIEQYCKSKLCDSIVVQ